MKQITALAFGEILWDIFGDDYKIGGAPFNYISWLAKLGAEGHLCSATGDDELGRNALLSAKERNVSTDFCTVNTLPTGNVQVKLSESKNAVYSISSPVAYDLIKADTSRINELAFDVFYFGTLAQRSENNKEVLNKILQNCSFKEIFCDINLREGQYDTESILNCAKWATILKLSDDESETVARHLNCKNDIKSIASKCPNLKIAILTKGENGSCIYDCWAERILEIEPVKVGEVVSTVGAGDSYSAAFTYNYLMGETLEICGKAASQISAEVVMMQGAI